MASVIHQKQKEYIIRSKFSLVLFDFIMKMQMINTAELKKKGRAEKNLKRLQTLLNWALVSLQVGTFTLAATLKTIV